MAILNKHRTARLKRTLELRRDVLEIDIGQHDQVPAVVTEIKLVVGGDLGAQFDTQTSGFRLGLPHTFVGWIESGHVPTLLREIDRVSPLSHADIERLPWRARTRHLHEKGV